MSEESLNRICVPMRVQLWAGEVLVAEIDSPALFSAALTRIIQLGSAQLDAPLTEENHER
jgi:hypothetical protein